jgi:hypothetical protein
MKFTLLVARVSCCISIVLAPWSVSGGHARDMHAPPALASQSTESWYRRYAILSEQLIINYQSVQELADGSMLISASFGPTTTFLLKLTSAGEIVWSRRLLYPGECCNIFFISRMRQLPDGRILAAGFSGKSPWYGLVSADGAISNHHVLSTTNNRGGYNAIYVDDLAAPKFAFLTAGVNNSDDGNGLATMLVKVDLTTLEAVWVRRYGSTAPVSALNVSDSGLQLLFRRYDVSGGTAPVIVSLDSEGQVLGPTRALTGATLVNTARIPSAAANVLAGQEWYGVLRSDGTLQYQRAFSLAWSLSPSVFPLDNTRVALVIQAGIVANQDRVYLSALRGDGVIETTRAIRPVVQSIEPNLVYPVRDGGLLVFGSDPYVSEGGFSGGFWIARLDSDWRVPGCEAIQDAAIPMRTARALIEDLNYQPVISSPEFTLETGPDPLISTVPLTSAVVCAGVRAATATPIAATPIIVVRSRVFVPIVRR